MDAVIPWSRLVGLIEPHYPNTGKGRPPHDLERMLRIYFFQHWFNLSDPQAEDAIYDSESMRRFARVELGTTRSRTSRRSCVSATGCYHRRRSASCDRPSLVDGIPSAHPGRRAGFDLNLDSTCGPLAAACAELP
jgi:hypothetical protein